MKFFKLTMIYIIMFIFLIAPLSYSSEKVCVLKKGSVITSTLYNMKLFIFFSELKEIKFVELMFKNKRLGSTKKNMKIIVIDIIKEKDLLAIAKVKLKKNPNIVFYVMNYNISCNNGVKKWSI